MRTIQLWVFFVAVLTLYGVGTMYGGLPQQENRLPAFFVPAPELPKKRIVSSPAPSLELVDGNSEVLQHPKYRRLPESTKKVSNSSLNRFEISASRSIDTSNAVYWCRISEAASRQPHFPHVMQSLGPCWSFFCHYNATKQCGILLSSAAFYVFGLRKHSVNPWVYEFLTALNCQIENVDKHGGFDTAVSTSTGDIIFEPYYEHGEQRIFNWFRNPVDAWSLRDTVLTNLLGPSHKLGLSSSQSNSVSVSVGILNRKGTRSLQDIENHVHRFEQITGIPVDLTDFDSTNTTTTLAYQAEWFYTHDIIVASHGAALTNAIFIKNTTTIVEAFPNKFFFVDFFGSLVHQVGAGHLYRSYYDGNMETAYVDFEIVRKEMLTRMRARKRNIRMPWEDFWFILCDNLLQRNVVCPPMSEGTPH